MVLNSMQWSKISYLHTFFPCYLIIGPSQIVFFQVILISCWISLRCYSRHSIQSTKINLSNETIKKLFTIIQYVFLIILYLKQCKTMHKCGSKKGKFEAVQGHFCCEVAIHIYVFHHTGETKTIAENTIVSGIHLST